MTGHWLLLRVLALDRLNEGFSPRAPGTPVEAKIFWFIVVAALHGEGGEGPQSEELGRFNTSLLQQQEQAGEIVRLRAILRSRRATRSSRAASGFVMEQHTHAESFLYQRSGF